MSYDKCRQKYLDKILDEFENKKLKLSNNKKVTDRKQAIAIALSMAQDKCKYTNKDLKQVETKVNNFLDKSHKEIQSLRGNYSLCKVCMENGAHVNWKSDQKSIFNKSIAGNSIMSKILRLYVSSMNKNILGNYYKR